MSDLERVVEACESLTQTFEQQASNINIALASQEKRISDKEKEVDNFLSEAQPEKAISQVIKIGGSKDYLYPVWFQFPERGGYLKIYRGYSWNKDTRPLNPNSIHQCGLLTEIEGAGNQFGGGARFMHIKRFNETYSNVMSHASFRMFCKNLPGVTPVFGGGGDGTLGSYCQTFSGLYLRGGGISYEFTSNWALDLKYSDVHEEVVLQEGATSGGAYKWTVQPIPFSEISSPDSTTTPFDTLLQKVIS